MPNAIRDTLTVEGQPFKLLMVDHSQRLAVVNAVGYMNCVDVELRETVARSPMLPAMDNAFEAFIAADGVTVVMWSYYSDQLHLIDGVHCRHIDSLTVGKNLGKALKLPNSNRIVIASVGDMRLHLVDIASRKILDSLQLNHPIGYITLAANQETIIATGGVYLGTNPHGSQLMKFEAKGNKLKLVQARDLSAEAHPRGLTMIGDNQILLSDQNGGKVRVHEIKNLNKTCDFDVGYGAGQFIEVPHSNGNRAVVISNLEATLYVLHRDGVCWTVEDRVHLSGSPTSASLSPDGRIIALAISGRVLKTPRGSGKPIIHGTKKQAGNRRDIISLVSLSEWRELDVIEVCKGPRQLIWVNQGSELIVACSSNGQIVFID